jgi:hypothetical protein
MTSPFGAATALCLDEGAAADFEVTVNDTAGE